MMRMMRHRSLLTVAAVLAGPLGLFLTATAAHAGETWVI